LQIRRVQDFCQASDPQTDRRFVTVNRKRGHAQQMAKRLVKEHGFPHADAVWALAPAHGSYREGEGAERFFVDPAKHGKAAGQQGGVRPAGRLTWRNAGGNRPTMGSRGAGHRRRAGAQVLVRETTPGKLPAFIESLLPEGLA
jgi:serine/threonine-protein kinase HipA